MKTLIRIVPLAGCLAAALAIAQGGGANQKASVKAAGHKQAAAKEGKGGVTFELAVTDDGFEPAKLTVKKGQPVKLLVTRKTDATCAKEIVIDDPPAKAQLPLNQPVTVAFTPTKTGELKFGCGMGKMVGGVILVE